jgi:hypothetical protein
MYVGHQSFSFLYKAIKDFFHRLWRRRSTSFDVGSRIRSRTALAG